MNSLLQCIQSQIKPLIEQATHPVAAFDADGTLWSCDVGRNFFHYQVQNRLLKPSHPQKQFNRIQQLEGKKSALQWLASIQVGCPLVRMQKWVKDFLKLYPPQPFLFQKHLINWLCKHHVEVFIVSSSLKWVLDPAVRDYYPIPKDHIIGVETKIQKGSLTNQLIHPAPIQEDKVLALKKRISTPPVLVAGNTLSDQALLEFSQGVRLVVAGAKKTEKNYLSEQNLLQIAKNNKWFYFEPISSSSSSGVLGASLLNT